MSERDPQGGGSELTPEESEAERRLRIRIGGTILVLALAVAVLGGINAYRIGATAADQSRDLRLSQYANCVTGANALRGQVRAEFKDLKLDAIVPVYRKIAGTLPVGYPPRRILTDVIDYLKARASTIRERIPDVPCRQAYPPLEGQTFPPRDQIERGDFSTVPAPAPDPDPRTVPFRG